MISAAGAGLNATLSPGLDQVIRRGAWQSCGRFRGGTCWCRSTNADDGQLVFGRLISPFMAAHNPRRCAGGEAAVIGFGGSAVVGGDGGLLSVVILAVFVGRRFRRRRDSGIRFAP